MDKKGAYVFMVFSKQNMLGAIKLRLSITVVMIVSSFIVHEALQAKESDEGPPRPKVGNFAVRGTMQPGPLLGFGQNIIDKHDCLGIVFPSWFFGKKKSFVEVLPYILYGILDDLSVLLAFPTAARFSYDGHHSSGSEDIFLQFEYAPYSHHGRTATNQISLVGAIYLPSGNECKNPATGFGSPSFFLGVVAEHLAIEWYAYTSYGALLTTSHDNHTKSGNQFFYQAGFGKNIAYCPERWTFMWMVEANGMYEQKDRVNGIVDQNSGFNMILVGPSLWFSTERIFLQFGAAAVAHQHFFGNQTTESAFISGSFGVRF